MNILTVLILFVTLVTTQAASVTLLIAGHSIHNVFKHKLASQIIENFNVYKNEFSSDIIVFNKGHQSAIDDFGVVQTFGGVKINANVTTIVVANLGTDEMNLDHLAEIQTFTRTERGLLAVELGLPTVQTQSLLDKGSLCWGIARLNIESPNTAYLCNELQVKDLVPTLQLDELRSSIESFGGDWIRVVDEQPRPFWPCLFASAAKAEKKVRKQRVEIIDAQYDDDEEEQIQEIVKKAMEKSAKKVKQQEKEEKNDKRDETSRKLGCKYRKSCYETGKIGLIEPFDFSLHHITHWWQAPPSQQHHLPREVDADQDGIPDSEDDDVDLTARKLSCKYRTACYKENNIPLSDKQQERERGFMTAKLQAPQGKKKTLKDIAERTLRDVKEREQEAKTRPMPKSMVVEKKLQEIEDQLSKKLDCKYRKSCYETGELPKIEKQFQVPTFFTTTKTASDDEEKPVVFDEMEELDKKVHCKYRKTCYETGIKPEIESEIRIASFRDLLDVPEQVETRKMSIQEQCKYRKSCYETGILPELNKASESEQLERFAQKEVSTIVPSNVNDLKVLCKYRKSCYQEVAVSDSADIVQTIRKRRILEKEVRKRRARRYRRRRRDVAMAIAAEGYYRKQTLKEKLHSKTGKAEKPAKTEVPQKEKKSTKAKEIRIIPESVAAQPIVEAKEGKKSKKNREETVEKEVEQPKPVKEEQKTKKKGKSVVAEEPHIEVTPVITKSKKQQKEKPVETTPEPQEEEPVVSKKAKKVKAEKPKTEEEKPKKSKSKKVVEEKIEDVEAKETEKPKMEEPVKEKKTKKEKVSKEPVKHVEKKEEHVENKENWPHDDIARLQCKYRKSCYETGKVGLIEPFDFSLHHITHWWQAPPSQQHHLPREIDADQDGIPDSEDDHVSETARKLSCKYRKSCYETGQLGLIEPYDFSLYHITHWWKAPPSQQHHLPREVDADHDGIPDSEDDDIDDAVKKLGCKYRKSCYDSGRLPDLTIHHNIATAPSLDEAIEASSRVQKLLKCKYRKSCYEEMGIDDEKDSDKVVEKEEVRQETIKKATKLPETKKHDKEPKQHHKKTHHKKEKEEKKREKDEEDEEDSDDEKPEKKVEKKKIEEPKIEDLPEIDIHSIAVKVKAACKYRKSCYASAKPRATNQDHSGTIARQGIPRDGTKCNIYYLSCREQLGLPPKEKAPIGPSGKRLCRKKKENQ